MNRRDFLKLAATGAIGLAAIETLPVFAGLPGATGHTLTVEATAFTFRRGEIITIAGRYAVNPITRKATPYLQRFMVTADVTSDDDEIPIFPDPEKCYTRPQCLTGSPSVLSRGIATA